MPELVERNDDQSADEHHGAEDPRQHAVVEQIVQQPAQVGKSDGDDQSGRDQEGADDPGERGRAWKSFWCRLLHNSSP